MIVECPKCHKKYEVEDMYIPIGGAPIRCPNCKNIFGIYVEPIDIPMTEVVEEENKTSASQTSSQKEINVSKESKIKETFKDELLQKDFPDLGQLGSFSSESSDNPFVTKSDLKEPQQTPDFGVPPAFAKPPVEEKIATPTYSGRVGFPIFDVLLAGFNLPPDFKSLPDTVQKAHKDAIKLARQLAKDILLYHKDDVERGLSSGNIKEVLREEIEKSYKFYSQRISPEIVNSTNYFKEALNKIIAKGEKIF